MANTFGYLLLHGYFQTFWDVLEALFGSRKDADKLGEALNKLAAEDPSFRYSRDEESNQTVIEGMGELHLEIIIDRLKREFKVEAEVGKPQVAYRETITEPIELWYTHKKQSGKAFRAGSSLLAAILGAITCYNQWLLDAFRLFLVSDPSRFQSK